MDPTLLKNCIRVCLFILNIYVSMFIFLLIFVDIGTIEYAYDRYFNTPSPPIIEQFADRHDLPCEFLFDVTDSINTDDSTGVSLSPYFLR